MTTEIDAIWEGDLLNRKEEAILLSQYIESIVDYTHIREDAQAFTIAVDAGYGEGKTWFLKRLAKQLELNHPVAFVDAWRDDLADEPLTALAATLKKAILPLAKKHPEIQSKFDTVIKKAGSVAKIAGKGLIKRGLGLLITKEAVDAAEQVFDGVSEAVSDAINDSVKEGGQEFVDNVADAIERVPPDKLMEQRIADFEAGQDAIEDLKASLYALVKALNRNDTHPPIVIIIDELDRCRPTYAIKLLEEVKHLFDVPGLVFVFGLHSGQLAHSVNGQYGEGFDGDAYLNRFLNRRYRLKEPSLEPFVKQLMNRSGIESGHLDFTQTTNTNLTTYGKIAFLLREYRMSARDATVVLENLQTCWILAGQQALLMPLLLPLIISKLKGQPRGSLAKPTVVSGELTYWLHGSNNQSVELSWWDAAMQYHNIMMRSVSQQHPTLAQISSEPCISHFVSYRERSLRFNKPLSNPANYSDLVEAVCRLSNPIV